MRASGWLLACVEIFVLSVLGEANERKNLILSSQKGVLPQELRVFMASLRAAACDAEVVIFSAEPEREDLVEVLETFSATMIPYDPSELSAQRGPMNLHRFTLFRQFLEDGAADRYRQVFLCDIRDVLFQSDPFEALAVDTGLGVAVEPETLPIGKCDIHSRWLSEECPTYKHEQVLEQIASQSRSCAGTTMGTQEAITKYCRMMEEEASRTVHQVPEHYGLAFEGRATTRDGDTWKGWCNDQGMHNAMLWTGRLAQEMEVKLYFAESSPLVTIGTLEVIRFNDLQEVLYDCFRPECSDGKVAAVVHQYDRVAAIMQSVKGLYGLPGEEFLSFQERYAPKK
mmetsp:Transcript_44412/g.69435  ORF Transcript_44412/g.69435 Transcript_44412/m.69435 type:complete len:341 (-) Transcript_44412:2207-3229(-)